MKKYSFSIIVLLAIISQSICAQYNCQYSDSLFGVGVELYNAKKYEEAYRMFLKCDNYDYEHLDSADNRLGYCKMWEGCCLYNLGKIEDAKKLNSKYYMCQPIDRRYTWKSDSISNLIDKIESLETDSFYENKKIATNLLEECISEEIHNLGDSNYWVANTLESCGWNYEQLMTTDKAYECYKKAFEIRSAVLPHDHVDYGKSLINIAKYYNLHNDDIILAISNFLNGLSILESNHYPHNFYYADRLYDLALLYLDNNEIEHAIDYAYQSLAIFKELYGTHNMSVGRGYHTLAVLFLNAGKYGYAEKHAKKAIAIRKEIVGVNHPYYNNSLSVLSDIYAKAGKYSNALEIDSIAVANFELVQKLNASYYEQQQDLYFNLIFKYANHLEKDGQYTKAVSYLTSLIQQASSRQYLTLNELMEYKTDLARCYCKMGDVSKAISIEKECYKMQNDYPNNRLFSAEDEPFMMLCYYYSITNNYSEILKLCVEALGTDTSELDNLNTLYEGIAIMLSENGLYSGSISFYHELLRRKLNTQYKNDIVNAYMDLAHEYSKTDSLTLSIKYSMKAEQYLDKNDSLYAENLYRLASYYSMNNQNDSAIYYYQKTIDLMKNANDYHYADILSLLSVCYDIDSKKEYYLQQAINEKKKLVRYSEDFYLSLSDDYMLLFGIYYKNGNYKSLQNLANDYLRIYDSSDKNYYTISIGLLKSFFEESDYTRAISYGNQLMEQYERVIEARPYYCAVLENMSQIYQKSGNIGNAIDCGMKAVQIIESDVNKYSDSYVKHLKWMNRFYSSIGEIEKAIENGNQIISIANEIYGENSLEVGFATHNLAFDYSRKTDYKKAIELYETAAKIKKELLGEDNPLYFVSLNDMAICFSEIGEYDKALNAFENILSLNKRIYGETSPQVAITLTEIGEIYGKKRDNNNELKSKEAAYKIFLGLKSIAPLDPHFVVRGMGRAYYKSKLYSKSSEIICEELYNSYNDLIAEIITLPNKFKERVWYRDRQLFIQDLPRLAYSTMSDSLICLMYDYSALFGKGLILNTNRSISQIAVKSDSITKERYDKLKKMRDLRESDTRKAENRRQYDIEDLDMEIHAVESTLISATHDFNKIREMVSLSWKDVQKQLEDDALAIEFFSVQYPDEHSDSVIYMALTLKKDYSTPKLFRLFNLNELPKWETGNEKRLYELIWKPIESELLGINIVYFSTWYSLNTIPIENLSPSEGIYMSDIYEMYRVSSTRELVLRHNNKGNSRKTHNMAIYGGLDYENTSQEQTKKFELSNKQLPSLYRGILDYKNNRGGVDYLPYSLTEAECIAQEADRHHVKSTLFLGVNGTEESFKGLSDSDVEIVHIATHGMCLNVNEADSYATDHNYRFLAHNLNSDPLNRSFLVMSGGNRLTRRDSIPENCEDGLLTANEISKMYLDNVELIVLSTCQSGLGEQSPEGVMGLQQGFKKAGVKSILMTLDTVNDKATQILMVEFYKNLMSGKSKHQSLKDAQKYLRKVDNGKYDKPEYWASFIMLDGLN